MPRFVVLLRGVNVGKGNRVRMAEFKALLENQGYTDVKTLLNSGNAVFASPSRAGAKHAATIAASLQERLGVTTPTIVKSAKELSTIVSQNPIVPPESDHSRFFVAFGPDEETLQALAALRSLAQEPERLVITNEAAYFHCPSGLLQSKVGAAMLGKAGRRITTRNWATVLKLAALAGASAT